MKENYDFSRRGFLGKMAAGTLGLAAAMDKKAGARINSPAISKNRNAMPPFVSDKKFVPVMITPYKPNKQIDFDVLSRLTDFYLAAGAKGFFANCQSSEMYKLNDEERIAVTRHVVRHVNGTLPVVASGSFGDTLEAKAEFTKKIYQTGINAVILISGHFARKKEPDEVLIDNFEKCFSLTDTIPLGTYECPQPYKRIITPDVFTYLLASNRVVYHKDTTIVFEKVKVKIDLAKGSHLEFYDACTANVMNSLQAGAKGISAVSGNFYPEILVWMCHNATNPEKQEQVRYIQEQITKAEKVIAKGYPLSSKYFLHKRGLPIEIVTRYTDRKLHKKNRQALDAMYETFLGWCDYLGIEPVKV
jgi:4-hydroxy-tetrahydrodipicolinate synthase